MSFRFLNITNTPSKALVDLLKENIIGTPSQSMLYQHLEVQRKVDKIEKPFFASLIKGKTILGTCCFCSRDTYNASKKMSSFYLRYFTFKENYRSAHQIKERKLNTKSLLREEIKHLLLGKDLIEQNQPSFFHYAYVDPKNSRSLNLCNEFGFEPVRKFSTVVFNRLNPKVNLRVEKLQSTEVSEMKEKLSHFYKDYTMFSFENLFHTKEYYVIRDEKRNIIAGVQANPDRWKVLELPGLSGKVILNVFSALPYLNRLIKKEYQFVTLEGIFVEKGCENLLEVIFETVLTKHNRNSAMTWVDYDSSLYKTLKSLDLGILDKINHEVVANIICKFVNIDKKEQTTFYEHPAYISGTDLT